MSGPAGLREWVAGRIPLLKEAAGVWIVGGGPRDSLLGRAVGDLDFAVEGDARALGRRVADALDAAYYDLDRERGAGRVVWKDPDGRRRFLDFSGLRSTDLESDLRARDFTANALAVPMAGPGQVMDPTGGRDDLRRKILRVPLPNAIADDPVRALRGVRLASELGFTIETHTRERIRVDGRGLDRVAPERVRDELFRVFSAPHPGRALRVLSHLALLQIALPEMAGGGARPAHQPHAGSAWDHSLAVVDRLANVLGVLGPAPDPEAAAEIALAHVSLRLGTYRNPLQADLAAEMVPGRTARSLLFLAALGHRGKAEWTPGPDRRRFPEDSEGILRATRRLGLSRGEADWTGRISRTIPWPSDFDAGPPLPPRLVYRFLRRSGAAAPEASLLMLADVHARSNGSPQEAEWIQAIESVRALFQAYWDGRARWLEFEPLIRGDVLAKELGEAPGPAIGRALEEIREAQAAGEITTVPEAIRLARRTLRTSRSAGQDAMDPGSASSSIKDRS
ncbi:MAG: hypothetical protein ACRDG5_02950 [Anaerolineales bacterium]